MSTRRTPLLGLVSLTLLLLAACTQKLVVEVNVTSPASEVHIGEALDLDVQVTSSTGVLGVTWSVNDVVGGSAEFGTVSAAGVYTAPSVRPDPAIVTVAAHSVADPNVTDSVLLTVTANGLLYVTDFGNSTLGVFADASLLDGDVAPVRGSDATVGLLDPIAIVGPGSSLWVGQCNAVTHASLAIWDDRSTLDGARLPDRVVGGVQTTIGDCAIGLAADPQRDLLYVLSREDSTVRVFEGLAELDGDVAPVRVIIPAASGGVNSDGALFLDVDNDRLYVGNYEAKSVEVFENASTLDGPLTAGRTLILPFAVQTITVDPGRDLLYATDDGASAVAVFDGASTLDGPVTPNRRIEGAQTGLTSPLGLLIDTELDTLYVADVSASSVSAWSGASTVDGDEAPARVLAGASTGFDSPWGLFLDPNR